MKMFETRKALNLFATLSEAAEGSVRTEFTKRCVALFEEKIVSEEGEFKEFKLTENDIKVIARELKI